MSVRVTIDGEGLKFEGDTNLVKASQIIAFMSNLVNDSKNVATGQSTENFALLKPKSSPREYLIRAKAKTNPEKIVAIGKYILERDGGDSFSANEVKETFKKIGEPLPSNFGRDIRNAIILNYIFEDSLTKDKYLITDSGRQAVDVGFVDNGESQSEKSRKRRRGSTQNSTVSDEVKNLELPVSWSGITFWRKESPLNQADKILWLLAFADSKNIKVLSAKEIDFLASRIKGNIPSKQVNALTVNYFKKGFLKVGNNAYSILQPGIDYLHSRKDQI